MKQEYKFSEYLLNKIHKIHNENEFGPRGAFRWYWGLTDNEPIETEDVEDFIIAFYNAYNEKYPMTY